MTAAATTLPTGTVTFLLTDIQGSTEAWQAAPLEMTGHVSLHYEILDHHIAAHGGRRPEEQGEGDSVVAVFDSPTNAIAAAIDAQRALLDQLPNLPVRMALHTGEAMLRDENNYVGLSIIRCARIRNCGHGGQILLSDETRRLVENRTAPDVTSQDLGVYGLRGLSGRTRIWQLNHPGLAATFPPLKAGASASNAWTYTSLDPAEQQLLRRLSIFATSFDVEAATFLGTGPSVTAASVVQSVRKLSDQQLLETVDGSNRLTLATALRDFCHARLVESPDLVETQHRHASWCANVADQLEVSHQGPAPAALIRDAPELVVAIKRSMAASEPTLVYRMLNGVGRYWSDLATPELIAELAAWLSSRTPSDGENYWSGGVARIIFALRSEPDAPIHRYADEALAIAEMTGDQVTQQFLRDCGVGELLGDSGERVATKLTMTS